MFHSRRCVTSEFSFIKHEEDKPKGDRELDSSMKQFVEDYVDEIDEELFIYANELLDEKMMQYGLTKEKCKSCGCATWDDEYIHANSYNREMLFANNSGAQEKIACSYHFHTLP